MPFKASSTVCDSFSLNMLTPGVRPGSGTESLFLQRKIRDTSLLPSDIGPQ